MATLFSNSTGNFTASGTWSLVDSTSYLNSEANSTATTTAFVSSSNFTPGAITIDGIAVKILSRSAAPSGTFSVRLFNATAVAAVAGTTVTINVTDLVTVNTSTNLGWVFMKFSAPVTLLAATNYNVQITSSVNAQVTAYRDATAGNWSRALRTTTNQAPAASDEVLIGGQYVSAGVNSAFTVTMNNTTSATTFGNTEIATNGVLAWGTSASTNYYYKVLGNITTYTNGTYTQGTAGTPIPSTSTAKLEFANTSNVQFGCEVRVGATFKTGGNVITNNALLTADASAGATSLTTNVSTNWKNGNIIALASTTRTRAECESQALTADAVGTGLTISAITNAHGGSGQVIGELINLTRNVQIFGTSTANQAYINITSTSIVDLQSTEFYNLGSNTALKRGIDVAITTGSITINNCSMHDYIVAGSTGINVTGATSNNYTLTNNVLYNIAGSGLITIATSGTTYTINNIICILSGAICISIGDVGGTTITNLTGVGGLTGGIQIADNSAASTNVAATMSNFTAHSNTTLGISFINATFVTNNPMALASTLSAWRNTTNGLNISNTFALIIDTVTAFGNATSNVTIGGTDCSTIYLKNMTLNAGTSLTCPIGLNFTTDMHEIYVDSSTFGGTTTHATGDVNVSALNVAPHIIFRNCLLSSATPISGVANITEGSYISLARFQQTSGNHKTFKKYGTITSDSVIFNSGPLSSRLTPNNASATNKLQGGVRKVAVPSGQTATIKVFVRKSVVGDGTAYNGNQPRLMLKVDPACGITGDVDSILATADNTYNGVFKALSATTPAISDNAVYQLYIDCDGTTGWVSVDDWSVS